MANTSARRTTIRIEKAAERVIKRLAFGVHSKIVVATPVDTGWARANWIPSIGRPVEKAAGSREAVGAARGAQSAGVARLLIYDLSQGDIWISNNVPYIERLNQGSSPQADARFVERAIEAGIRSVRG